MAEVHKMHYWKFMVTSILIFSTLLLVPQIVNVQTSMIHSHEEESYIQIGRAFLKSISHVTANYTAGKVLSLSLENKTANFYWQELIQLAKPNVTGIRSTWVIRFEQALRVGHYFEVWIDSETSQIIGGEQCR